MRSERVGGDATARFGLSGQLGDGSRISRDSHRRRDRRPRSAHPSRTKISGGLRDPHRGGRRKRPHCSSRFRKLLPTEPDRLVRLRIAEALLKLQPNDGVATSCLSDLISNRNEPKIGKPPPRHSRRLRPDEDPIAIASLTEAWTTPVRGYGPPRPPASAFLGGTRPTPSRVSKTPPSTTFQRCDRRPHWPWHPFAEFQPNNRPRSP